MNKKLPVIIVGIIVTALGALSSQPLFAQAQQTAVPVEQEPRHWVVFENKYVRIYDALIPCIGGSW